MTDPTKRPPLSEERIDALWVDLVCNGDAVVHLWDAREIADLLAEVIERRAASPRPERTPPSPRPLPSREEVERLLGAGDRLAQELRTNRDAFGLDDEEDPEGYLALAEWPKARAALLSLIPCRGDDK